MLEDDVGLPAFPSEVCGGCVRIGEQLRLMVMVRWRVRVAGYKRRIFSNNEVVDFWWIKGIDTVRPPQPATST